MCGFLFSAFCFFFFFAGGTFALYSLICRHAKVSMLPNSQVVDEELSTYKLESMAAVKNRSRIKEFLEGHRNLHIVLLLVVMLGTCMVIGDGLLTPALSVFSAVSGLELSMSKGNHECKHFNLSVYHSLFMIKIQNYLKFDSQVKHFCYVCIDAVVPITCFIIACLFALQHYGTHSVGFLFAPVVLVWLFCISTLGVYNIIHWNPQVYHALSPYYMYIFLRKTRKSGWMSLGGILLCITGNQFKFQTCRFYFHFIFLFAHKW